MKRPEGMCTAIGCERICASKKWTLCRPCAIAHSQGLAVFSGPCVSYERDPYFPRELSCATCGFDSAEHPGQGIRQENVVIAA